MTDAPIPTETKSSDAPLLFLQGVRKHFGGVFALKGVDFELRSGEIHALLGENGAGKSTLIRVLGGICAPDAGTILINGEKVDIRTVADADRCGIRIIHQELSLAPNLSIAENIYLGRETSRLGFLDRGELFDRAERLVNDLGLAQISSVRTLVCELSVAHRQLVEIARALSCRARILVLDEPTSALSESETAALFETLRNLRSQRVGIIYISHRLEEITELSDRITVLRDGESVGTEYTAAVDRKKLVRWMVGRDIADNFHRAASTPGPTALKVLNLKNRNVHTVSFELSRGEILGIAGLVGSGRTELSRAIFGIDSLEEGQIYVDGAPVKINRPQDALEAGIVLVPEDRKLEGLIMTQSVAFNIALPWAADWITTGMPSMRRRNRIVDKAVRNFGVKLSNPEQTIDSLSGGNQQKTLLARWMERLPKVLILDEPTRGVDVGARHEIFKIIDSLVSEGMAVLFISSDLDEVFNLSHRIAIYRNGRIIKIAKANELTAEKIMQHLTGPAVYAHRPSRPD